MADISIKYQLTTEVAPDGVITQTLELEREGIMEHLSRWVVRAQDEGIRQALIQLGWTPPPD
jgi:hypothetical protein